VFVNLVNIMEGVRVRERYQSWMVALIRQTREVRGEEVIEFKAGGFHQSGR
jgi:hypothetical protein